MTDSALHADERCAWLAGCDNPPSYVITYSPCDNPCCDDECCGAAVCEEHAQAERRENPTVLRVTSVVTPAGR